MRLLILGFLIAALTNVDCIAGTRTLAVKPVWKYSAMVVVGEFDTPEEAFAAQQAVRNETNPPPHTLRSLTLHNLHRWRPDINGLWDGQPTVLVSDVTSCYSDGSCQTDFSSGPAIQLLAPKCPIEKIHIGSSEYNWVAVDDQSNLPDRTFRCELLLPVDDPDPKSCPIGNPVYPSTGLKSQLEKDYESVGSYLEFERVYRNTDGQFWSPASAALVDNSLDDVVSSACLMGHYIENISTPVEKPFCFRRVSLTDTSGSISITRSDGRVLRFNASSAGFTAEADVKHTLTRKIDVNGDLIWLLHLEKGAFEVYRADGLLHRVMSLDGRKNLTFTYQNGSVPSDGAAGPAVMLAQTDQYGRRLEFSFQEHAQILQLKDPSGSTFSYAYDALGNLSSVTDSLNFVKSYVYNETSNINNGAPCSHDPDGFPKALTGILHGAVRFADFKYDCFRRAISTEHAGETEKFSFGYLQGSTSITDPLGSVRTEQYVSGTGRSPAAN